MRNHTSSSSVLCFRRSGSLYPTGAAKSTYQPMMFQLRSCI